MVYNEYYITIFRNVNYLQITYFLSILLIQIFLSFLQHFFLLNGFISENQIKKGVVRYEKTNDIHLERGGFDRLLPADICSRARRLYRDSERRERRQLSGVPGERRHHDPGPADSGGPWLYCHLERDGAERA